LPALSGELPGDEMKVEWKEGWAVEIERRDGTTFFASGRGEGIYPVVWHNRNRKGAVNFKRDLLIAGFHCKVVPVKYVEPVKV
jgi:hypothetical protein